MPQLDEWQFFIATPLVDSKGPRSAYDQVLRALLNEGIDSELPWRRIFLRSPKDPILKSLGKQSMALPQESFRAVNAAIGDRFVEDAFLYTGWIDISELSPNRYRVIYAPSPGGGSVPHRDFQSVDAVRQFLEADIRIRKELVDEALSYVHEHGWASIPNVRLTTTHQKKLGLA